MVPGQGMELRQWEPEYEGGGSREVVLIVRFVLNSNAELRYGEFLDGQAVRQGCFVSLPELACALEQWLQRRRSDNVQVADEAR